VSVGTFGVAVQETVLILFLTRELGFTAATIGLIFTFGGGGSLLGAVLAGRAARLVGVGWAIVLGNLLWGVGVLIIPLANIVSEAFLIVAVGQMVANIGGAMWGVNQMSLRQNITPVGLFARATAARRVLMISLQMTGAAIGAFLGTVVGLRATLIIGAAGLVVGFLLVLFSPVRKVRSMSEAMENA
jgi:MFS family permease